MRPWKRKRPTERRPRGTCHSQGRHARRRRIPPYCNSMKLGDTLDWILCAAAFQSAPGRKRSPLSQEEDQRLPKFPTNAFLGQRTCCSSQHQKDQRERHPSKAPHISHTSPVNEGRDTITALP